MKLPNFKKKFSREPLRTHAFDLASWFFDGGDSKTKFFSIFRAKITFFAKIAKMAKKNGTLMYVALESCRALVQTSIEVYSKVLLVAQILRGRGGQYDISKNF